MVIYLENHSFDSLLGFWCDDHPGRCPDGGMPSSVTLSNGAVVTPATDPDTVPNVSHSVAAQEAAIDGGKMDGWQNIPDGGCDAATGYRCVSGYQPAQIPNITTLAQDFADQRPHLLAGRLSLLGRAHGHRRGVRGQLHRRQPGPGQGREARARLGL